MIDKYAPGRRCTVSRRGDICIDREVYTWVDQKCVIVKRTKGGLIQVALDDDPKKVFSFGQQNIVFVDHNWLRIEEPKVIHASVEELREWTIEQKPDLVWVHSVELEAELTAALIDQIDNER